MTKKFVGLSIIAFVASIAGILVSFLTLREDVISTAKTLFEYFPASYGVTPAVNWEGAIILAVFTSVLQIVSASVAFSSKYSPLTRIGAIITLIASAWFDNWTDVVFRSGYLTGDTKIATVSTLAFYTFGSEITQSLSWLVFLNIWRLAISDVMWGTARLVAGYKSIAEEWGRFKSAAHRAERRERGFEGDSSGTSSRPQTEIREQSPNTQSNQQPARGQRETSDGVEIPYHPLSYPVEQVQPPRDIPPFLQQQQNQNRRGNRNGNVSR